MGNQNIEALAAKLRRPARALSGLSRLEDAELALLAGLIDDAHARQGRDIDQALRRAFPQPLRILLLGRSNKPRP